MAFDRPKRPALVSRLSLLAVIATSFGAACSQGAEPTPTPMPSPTATVVSVAAPFKAAIASKSFQFEGVVSGTYSEVIDGVSTDHHVSGTFLYKAGDYLWRLSTTTGDSHGAADEQSTIEYVGVGKYRYTCDEHGTWIREDRPGGTRAKGLGGVFAVNRKIEDLGIDTLKGQQLHKLAWVDGPGVSASVVDFEGQLDVTGMTVRVYFWADDHGHPAGLTFRIAEPGGDQAGGEVIWNLDVVFTKLDGITISAPKMPAASPSGSPTLTPTSPPS